MEASQIKSLEQRVKNLESEWAIRNLVSTYLLKSDHRDVEGYIECFAEDGELDTEGLHLELGGFDVPKVHVGREAIAKVFSESIAPIPCFMWHVGHTPHITVDGDSAEGRWNWTAVFNIPGFGPMESGGIYNDEYVNTADGWKIKKRVISAWYATEFGKWNEDTFFGQVR